MKTLKAILAELTIIRKELQDLNRHLQPVELKVSDQAVAKATRDNIAKALEKGQNSCRLG